MYCQIQCSRKCFYQKDGKCIKKSSLIKVKSTDSDERCVFYSDRSQATHADEKVFWSTVARTYF